MSNSTLRIGSTWSPGRTCTCNGSRDGSISLCRQVFGQRGPGSPPTAGSAAHPDHSGPARRVCRRPSKWHVRGDQLIFWRSVSRSSQHEARPSGVGTATTCRLDLTGPLVSIVPQHPKHLSLLQKHVLPGRGLKAAEHFVFSLRSSSLLQPEALPARSRQTLFGVPFGSALATVREHSLRQRPRRHCAG